MSRKRKRVYLTLIAVGLAAVVVDRIWLTESGEGLAPSKAAAAERSAPAAVASGRPGEGQAESGNGEPDWFPPPGAMLPKSWSSLPSARGVTGREPFLPSPAFLGAVRADGGDRFAEAPAESRALRFEQRHRLLAIACSATAPRAVVDDRILSLQDVVDGHRLVEIGTFHVVFDGPDGRITLKLPRDEVGGDH